MDNKVYLTHSNFEFQEKKALEVLKNVDKKLREIKAPTGEEHNPAMSCHDVKENHPDLVKKRKQDLCFFLPEQQAKTF